jgi:hypothetical protein
MKANLTSMASSCFTALLLFVAAPAQAQMQATSGPSDPAYMDTEWVNPISVDRSDVSPDLDVLGLPAPATLDASQWKAFGSAVEHALESPNEGVQTSALRLIIAYGKEFNMSNSAVVDVMHLYREGHSEQIRRMAVVSLSNMHSDLAEGFLELSSQYERSDAVRATIDAVLANRTN